MLCSQATDLIKELDKSKNNTLPPYNTDGVRKVVHEVNSLYDKNVESLNNTETENSQDIMLAVKVRHTAIKRNKRCLLAYTWNRLERIREMRWQIGSILPAEIKSNLSQPEQEWFSNYCRSLAYYMKSFRTGSFDFLQDEDPPQSLYIQVRCLTEAGELELEDGNVVMLQKNSEYLMSRSLCEPLIKQGILEHIK